MKTREPTPAAQFAALLARFSPEIVAFAKRCMPRIRRTLPGCLELIYEYRHCVVISFAQTEQGAEGIVALSIYPEEIRLYFQGGKFLPDPKKLLQGSAGVRYVVLESASDIDKPDIKALFKAAIKFRKAKLPKASAAGKGAMIIKSVLANKKPRKAA
jgi:hypothetical protein